ncbi:VC0807 family protein [Pseudonocardia aurantiaca]|uniref:VC0807 family protein n=1 Tax=Pseudonocardia aurantiaca TaxID=75290 RepID=A0ABW4FR83_9PSEU
MDRSSSSPFRAAGMLRGLAWDVGLPLVAYYGLHLLGVGDWTALLAATLLAGVRIVVGMVRERVLNPFATVMLVVFGLGVLLALVTGDAEFVLLKNSIITGAVGLVFLATSLVGRPLTLAASKSFQPERAAEIDEQYRTNPGARHAHRLSSTVWGAGLLLEALVRVPLIYALPISVMVGVSEALSVVTFGALIGWNIWYARRATRRLSSS